MVREVEGSCRVLLSLLAPGYTLPTLFYIVTVFFTLPTMFYIVVDSFALPSLPLVPTL